MLVFTSDKQRLLTHFQKDPVLFAYHIGDLDDFFFPDCQWAVAYNETAKIEDAILLYFGGTLPIMGAFGLTTKFPNLLREVLEISPRRFNCHFQKGNENCFTGFSSTYFGTHYKMHLRDTSLLAAETDKEVKRLDRSHEPALLDLYRRSYPGNYFVPRMLETGKYFGLFDSGQLLAVAGVHVDSEQFRIAALGNITTDPRYRGRGFARRVTSGLCSELVREKKMVCLNVKADNLPAIRCYEKLGFVKVHEYEEAQFELK